MFYDVVLTVNTCAESGEGSLAWALAQAAEYDSAQIIISKSLAGQAVTLRARDTGNMMADKTAGLHGVSLEVQQGVTLLVDARLALYEDSQLVLYPGSSLQGTEPYSDVAVFEGGAIYADSCTIGLTLNYEFGEGEADAWQLNNVTLTAQCPFVLGTEKELPEHWNYTCTHSQAYEKIDGYVLEDSDPLTITKKLLADYSSGMCDNVLFHTVHVESELSIDAGVTWYVENLHVHSGEGDYARGSVSCGKGVTLVGDNTDASVNTEASFYIGGDFSAQDITFQGTVLIQEGAAVSGSNYHFAAQVAAGMELVGWDGSTLPEFLPGVSYDVTRDDASFALFINGVAGDVSLTSAYVESLVPAGFASGCIGGIRSSWNTDGGTLTLAGVVFMPRARVETDSSLFLSLSDTTLAAGMRVNVEYGCLQNVDLAGAYISSGYGSDLSLNSCYGAAEIELASCPSLQDCDLSAVTWNTLGMEEMGVEINLSGNYWGTTDMEEILSRFGDYAEYVRIDSVLSEWSAPDDPFVDSLLELAPSPTLTPGIYAIAEESRVAVGTQRLYKLNAEEAGAWNISVQAGSFASPLMLSVGTLAADGSFQAAESLYLAPDAATTALRGVCDATGQSLYICVQATQSTSSFSLNVSGTQAATAGLFTQNNDPSAATSLAADGSTTRGWVGYGDATDFYRVEMSSAGSLSIALAELESAARLRVYEQRADGSLAQLESIAARPGDTLDRTLQLTAGSFFIEVASLDAGAGLHNSAYALTLEKEESSPHTSPIGIA